jgi:hypothetical protein
MSYKGSSICGENGKTVLSKGREYYTSARLHGRFSDQFVRGREDRRTNLSTVGVLLGLRYRKLGG